MPVQTCSNIQKGIQDGVLRMRCIFHLPTTYATDRFTLLCDLPS